MFVNDGKVVFSQFKILFKFLRVNFCSCVNVCSGLFCCAVFGWVGFSFFEVGISLLLLLLVVVVVVVGFVVVVVVVVLVVVVEVVDFCVVFVHAAFLIFKFHKKTNDSPLRLGFQFVHISGKNKWNL